MVQKGGTKSLIYLLERSADPEAQRFAALALGNIASTQENRIPMVDEVESDRYHKRMFKLFSRRSRLINLDGANSKARIKTVGWCTTSRIATTKGGLIIESYQMLASFFF